MYRLIIAGFVCCGAVASAAALEKLKRIEGVYLGKVGVVNGAVVAGKDRGSGWRFRKTDQGVLIYLGGGERAGAWGGWYLNYDHKGKDPKLGLVPAPGPGCY